MLNSCRLVTNPFQEISKAETVVTLSYKHMPIRLKFDLLHFFQPIKGQQTSKNFTAVMSLVERSLESRNFDVQKLYFGDTEVT